MKLRGQQTAAATANMSLIEHLNELRSRLIKCVLAVLIAMFGAFWIYDPVVRIAQGPYKDLCARKNLNCPKDGALVVLDAIGGFGTRLKISTYIGIAIALPVLLWQLWRFISPGLLDKEKRYAIPYIVSSLVLFVAGASLAWFIFPKGLEWLTAYAGSGTTPLFVIDKYLNFLALLMLGFGGAFQFPVVLVTLQLLGVVKTSALAKQRRLAILVIIVIAAVITPGNDPISMFGLAIPMYFLFEASLIIGWFIERRKTKRAARAA